MRWSPCCPRRRQVPRRPGPRHPSALPRPGRRAQTSFSKALRRRTRRRAFSTLEVLSAHVRQQDIAYPPHVAPGRRRDQPLPDRLGRAHRRASAARWSATANAGADRNAIGAHGGAYSVYRALAVAAGRHGPDGPARPDQHPSGGADRPAPAVERARQDRLARPLGRTASPRTSPTEIAEGVDIRPTIAVTKARITLPEIAEAIAGRPAEGRRQGAARDRRRGRDQGRHRPGLVSARRRRAVRRGGDSSCAARSSNRPAACIPSWSPGRTWRCSCRRSAASRSTSSATRPSSATRASPLTCRVHDECNGSDVFGSDICTCRPYLTHGIEECVAPGAGGRHGPDRLQPQGRPGAGRGDQVPGLQRPQAPAGRRPGGDLLRAHRVRGRRAGRALPAADARHDPLAGHPRGSTASSRCPT